MHLDRLIAVLEAVAIAGRAVSPAEVQQVTGIPRPTGYRLLQTLTEHRLLNVPDDASRYLIGDRLKRIAQLNLGITHAAEPINTLEKTLFGHKPNGIAIKGYDTVAYFTQSKPVMGNSEFATEWMGATWHFGSQEHLSLFTENPERYAPQYGGYCAYGVSQGYLVKIEPDQWSIEDNKLYLNFDADVQIKWVKDIPGYVAKADDAITGLLAQD